MRRYALVLALGLLATVGTGTSKPIPVLRWVGGDTIQTTVGAQFRIGVANSHFRWSSSNPAVVAVNPSGMVKALAAGQAYLRATFDNRSDSVLVIVRDLTPPPVVTGLGSVVAAVGDTVYAYDVTWTGSSLAATYRWVQTAGPVVDSGIVTSPSVRLQAARGIGAPAPSVCVSPVSIAGVPGAPICTTVAMVLADSARVLFYLPTDTAFAQGARSLQLELGQSRQVCAYVWARGRVMPDPSVTVTVSDPVAFSYTPDADLARYASVCLSKLPAGAIWPQP